jgi:hypothetical protein
MNYCLHCGAKLDRQAQDNQTELLAVCPNCGKQAALPAEVGSGETVEFCSHCRRPVPHTGTHCPWCGEEIRSAFTAAVNEGVLVPSPFQPRWQISHWFGEGQGKTAPHCPKCGQKVRGDSSERRGHLGVANLPWNAGWDGTCEHCDFHFEMTLVQQLHFKVNRTTRIKPENMYYQTFFDEGIALSGIEITVTDNQFGREPEETTLFLSMGEVARLMEALEAELSVYMNQFDWSEDWT